MRNGIDPLGNILLRIGALTEDKLEDVLDLQQRKLPLASLCYVMGYADEETLARVLSRQVGMPAVVLDRSEIRLDVLGGISQRLLMRHNLMPIYEDAQHLFVAADDPRLSGDILRELQFIRGKTVVPHIALQVTLARTLRACYSARKQGHRYWRGLQVAAGEQGGMYVVRDAASEALEPPAPRETSEDVTSVSSIEIDIFDSVADEPVDDEFGGFDQVDDGKTSVHNVVPVHVPEGLEQSNSEPVEAPPPMMEIVRVDSMGSDIDSDLMALEADSQELEIGDSQTRDLRGSERPSYPAHEPTHHLDGPGPDGPTEDIATALVNLSFPGRGLGQTRVASTVTSEEGGPTRLRMATAEGSATAVTSSTVDVDILVDPGEQKLWLEDGDGDSPSVVVNHEGPQRVLVVDDDFATRHLLLKGLRSLGVKLMTSVTGGEAVRRIKSDPPDMVIIDVMLPEIDGFQVCRAIKQSHRYRHIMVVLMSAVIATARVSDELLERYGADAYFEKPLDIGGLKQRVATLLAQTRARQTGSMASVGGGDERFAEAIALYRAGDIDGAVEVLRAGLAIDPLSAKYHFVLANLLQKKSRVYEAIDEYEATLDLKPDYFPALTRLAYLYYQQGFSAKAIEMWRRSLPHCSDANMRQSIEVFMRRLIADMQS